MPLANRPPQPDPRRRPRAPSGSAARPGGPRGALCRLPEHRRQACSRSGAWATTRRSPKGPDRGRDRRRPQPHGPLAHAQDEPHADPDAIDRLAPGPRLRRLEADEGRAQPRGRGRVRGRREALPAGQARRGRDRVRRDRQEAQGDPLGREGPVSTWPRPSTSAASTSPPTTATSSSSTDYPGTEYLDKLVSREYAHRPDLARARPTPRPSPRRSSPGTPASTASSRCIDTQRPRASRPSSTSGTTTRPARSPTTPCSGSPTTTWPPATTRSAAIYYDQLIDRPPQEPVPPARPARRASTPG